MTTLAVGNSLAQEVIVKSGRVREDAWEALSDLIEREMSLLLEDFISAPSRAGLFEVGTLAEVVILGRDLPSGRRFATLIGNAGLRWIESGLFEDVCFAEAQLMHHTMLLLHLAGTVPPEVLQALSNQGMIARSEWPVLTQLCSATLLNQLGVHVPLPETETADFTAWIDKRCLRAQSSEYDLALLLTAAQLLQDEAVARSRPTLTTHAPRILPRVLLVQSLRAGNWNWASVLLFLCRRSFGLPVYLDEASREALREVPATLNHFDLPKDIHKQSDHFSRSVRALRLRSAAALAMYMDCSRNG